MTDTTPNPDRRPQPSAQQLSAAEARVFDQQTSGLLGLDGKPLGTTTVNWGPIAGVEYGIAFLFMADGHVGLCHLEAGDCEVCHVQVGPDIDPVDYVRLRVPPPQQQHAAPWAGAPGTLVELMAARHQWMRDSILLGVIQHQGLDPNNLPDGWQPPEEVQQVLARIDARMHGAASDRSGMDAATGHQPVAPEHEGLDLGAMLTSVVAELERTRAAVGDFIDNGVPITDDAAAALEQAVWPNGGRANYPSPTPPGS